MKKLLLLVLCITTSTLLFGCANEQINPTPVIPEVEEKPQLSPEELTQEVIEIREMLNNIDVTENTEDDFDLITNIGDLELDWTSDHEAIVIDDDEAIVEQHIADIEVDLTVSTVFNDVLIKATHEVVVEQIEMVSPVNANPLYVMNYLEEKLSVDTDYLLHSAGNSVGEIKILFSTYNIDQSIMMNKFKYNDVMYFEADSVTIEGPYGKKENVYHESYFDNGQIAYYTAKEEIVESDMVKFFNNSQYINTYGVLPTADNFTGYVINEDTVISSSYDGLSNGLYKFSYVLNTTTSCEAQALRTRKFGTLEEITMNSVKLSVFINEDWDLVSYDTNEEYLGKMFGFSTNLMQKITTTFTKIDVDNMPESFPNIDKYVNALKQN